MPGAVVPHAQLDGPARLVGGGPDRLLVLDRHRPEHRGSVVVSSGDFPIPVRSTSISRAADASAVDDLLNGDPGAYEDRGGGCADHNWLR